MINTHWSQ